MSEGFRMVPPHDDRYGRLFTDGDVGNLIDALLSRLRSDQRLAQDENPDVMALAIPALDAIDLDQLGAHLSFPVGEPMFVLRPTDPHAVTALSMHLDECVGQGAPADYLDAVVRAIHAFERWNTAARVGVPED